MKTSQYPVVIGNLPADTAEQVSERDVFDPRDDAEILAHYNFGPSVALPRPIWGWVEEGLGRWQPPAPSLVMRTLDGHHRSFHQFTLAQMREWSDHYREQAIADLALYRQPDAPEHDPGRRQAERHFAMLSCADKAKFSIAWRKLFYAAEPTHQTWDAQPLPFCVEDQT